MREYIQSQRPERRIGTRTQTERFPEPHNPNEPADLVNPDDPPEPAVDTPGVLVGSSPRSIFSQTPATLRSRLPQRHVADNLIDRYFKQVQPIFWVFPQEQFMQRVDKTYMFLEMDGFGGTPQAGDEKERKEIEVHNWMCCLFTVLALGCSKTESWEQALKPSELFGYAKCLSRYVVEDESILSIQALLLMVALHLRGSDCRVCILRIQI